LGLAQPGGKHPKAKPWKGEGPGVFEIVEDYGGDAYVLHAFQKKSKSGIKTPKYDVDLIRNRIKRAAQHYTERYPKLGAEGKHHD